MSHVHGSLRYPTIVARTVYKPPFTHKGAAVLRGTTHEAQARSSTMARRIANALNRYQPGPKGY